MLRLHRGGPRFGVAGVAVAAPPRKGLEVLHQPTLWRRRVSLRKRIGRIAGGGSLLRGIDCSSW